MDDIGTARSHDHIIAAVARQRAGVRVPVVWSTHDVVGAVDVDGRCEAVAGRRCAARARG